MSYLRSFPVFLILMNSGMLFSQPVRKSYDIIVYGGTSAGVIAAVTAKQQGKTVLLVEPGKHLGGLTTGGLGHTDIGNKFAITGISHNFYRHIGQYYGRFEQWIFEPHVAEEIFKKYIKEKEITVLFSYRMAGITKQKNTIVAIKVENSLSPSPSTDLVIKGKVFIDCSYEGDLMANAGISYTVGREDNKQYNETYNGVQIRNTHQFPDSIDPYKIKGDPASGLLWGISHDKPAAIGSGDSKIQTYNYRLCLSKDPANRNDITQPDDYVPERYELLLRVFEKRPPKNIGDFLSVSLMPNNKTDINNNGPFSTDMIGVNWAYADADYGKRAQINKAHENYIKGFLFFVGHDGRVPEHIRREMLQWGYPKDEFTDNNNWTPQLYVREARRMVGSYVMTQANCESREIVDDGVGLAAYTMDSHNAQRVIINGMVKNEGDIQIKGFGPYPVSYRCLVPKQEQCSNLLVPVCLSASHIAYGSIRMEPVFMVLAQSAALAASMAIDKKIAVQNIDVKQLQSVLRSDPMSDGSLPDILVDDNDAPGVTIVGDWKMEKNSRGCYGPSILVNENAVRKEGYVRFTPGIQKEDEYVIYTYVPKVSGASSTLQVIVNDGAVSKPVIIKMNEIEVKGQTSGEWVSLGKYHLKPGKGAYVDITNTGADGIVLADAVLFTKAR